MALQSGVELFRVDCSIHKFVCLWNDFTTFETEVFRRFGNFDCLKAILVIVFFILILTKISHVIETAQKRKICSESLISATYYIVTEQLSSNLHYNMYGGPQKEPLSPASFLLLCLCISRGLTYYSTTSLDVMLKLTSVLSETSYCYVGAKRSIQERN